MKKLNIKKYIDIYELNSWLIVGIWMVLIYCLSNQPAAQSSELSGGFSELVIRIAEGLFRNEAIRKFFVNAAEMMVRKTAHFTEYFILSILVMNAMRNRKIPVVKYVFLFCLVYATGDEVHQYFVPGRALRVLDIVIDGMGAYFGICSFNLIVQKIRASTIKRLYRF